MTGGEVEGFCLTAHQQVPMQSFSPEHCVRTSRDTDASCQHGAPGAQLMRTQMSEEIWRPVVGYEGLYEVSSLGRVMSLTRPTGHASKRPPRVMRLKTCRSGYKSARIWKDGIEKTIGVHVLVLTAFGGPKPGPQFECAHNDGSRDNNVPSNLRWATKSENQRDRVKHNTTHRGGLKLNPDLVSEMRQLAQRGVKRDKLAEQFGVSARSVQDVVTRQSWRHVA